MNDRSWIRVADLADIQFRKPFATTVDETDIFLYRTDDEIIVLQNACPHYGAPLTDGTLRDSSITCPWHNAQFDLKTGSLLEPPALDDLAKYDVKTDNGEVFVRLTEKPRISMPEGKDSRRVLIVGGGAGGNACAESLRREGFAGQITILTADGERPYDRPMLSKGFVKGMADESWLPLRGQEFYSSLHIDVLTKRRVDSLDVDEMAVHCDTGDRYTADKIVLATGGRPRRLNIPGWDKRGVHTLRSAEDGRKIKADAENAQSVVVIGAGFIGMELASDLRQRGLTVHVVAPEELPMSLMFGSEIGAAIKTLHEEQGVAFHLGTKPKEILGEDRCREVRLFDDSTVEADLIVAGLGVEPEVSYLSNTGLADNGEVRVDERLQTNAPDIFAVGDIAAVPYPNGKGRHRIEHWVVAESQGMHAGRSILGRTEAYAKLPFFWSRQYETSLKYVGFPGTRTSERGAVGDLDGMVGFFDGDELVGAASLGRSEELLQIEDALVEGRTISPDQFQEGTL